MHTNPPKFDPAAFVAVGDKIAGLRRAKGWTGTELAARAGISRSHLSYIENGRRPAAEATYKRLAVALDVPAEYFAQVSS